MTLFNLFSKKQKAFRAFCAITKEPMEPGFGYLLTTDQVIASRRYWDMVMTEPETLSYTVQHFKNEPMGTQMRTLIFEKHAGKEAPWIISDSVIGFFNVDKTEARARAEAWWKSEGGFLPAGGESKLFQQSAEYNALRQYAIFEAGRSRVQAA